MKIAICGSLNFTYEFEKLAGELRLRGFEVRIPLTSERILNGECTLDEIKSEKETGLICSRAIKFDSIRAYYDVIVQSDAILVANYDKNGVAGYVGGNSFLEMGFAHVLRKKIFLLNGIPDMGYSDEIKVMQPVVLEGDLGKIE